MAHTACEMIWLKNLLVKFDFRQFGPMPIHCDNQYAIYIAHIPVSYERTKHIEVDFHFVKDVGTRRVITFQFTLSLKHLTDLLTKAVSPQMFSNLCNKLGILDIYVPP